MKADPGKLGRIFNKLVALKGKDVTVIDQNGSRYEGRLRLDGELIISGFELLADRLAGEPCVLRVGPVARVQKVAGFTITVDLTTMLDLWTQTGMHLEQEQFFASSVEQVKLYEARVHDEEAAEKEALDDSEGECGRHSRDSLAKTHYLQPGDVITSVRVHADVTTISVSRGESNGNESS